MIKRIFSFIIDSLIPIVIIILSLLILNNVSIGNIKFDNIESITLALFSLLAVDSILDKYKTKNRISDKIDEIQNDIETQKNEIEIITNNVKGIGDAKTLKNRSDFGRLESVFSQANKELFISGINLEGIIPSCNVIKERLKSGVKVRLLLLDPEGKYLEASCNMSGVLVEKRKNKIHANIDYLKSEFQNEISTGKLEIKTIDSVLPFSFIGIDICNVDGRLIVQNYLYQTPSSESLLLEFTKKQLEWYILYCGQLEKMWNNGIAK